MTNHDRLADDLARFLAALYDVATEDGPPAGDHSFNRGGSLAVWDNETRATIDQLADEIDVDAAVEVWDAALATPWAEPDVCPNWAGIVSLGDLGGILLNT